MSSHYDKKVLGHHNNRGHGYTIRATNIQHASNILEPDSPSDNDSATDEVSDEAYHIDVNNTADEVHQRFKKSFNYGINGQLWQDYKEPLKESLRNALKAANAWLA